MAIKWYHNAKTGEIGSYQQSGGLTDFPRGLLLAYGDYLTTGLESRQKAIAWAAERGACNNCRATRTMTAENKCLSCGSELEFHQIQESEVNK